MKAVISRRYGSPDVLEIRQIPMPEPKSDEVLIKVAATTVSRSDCGMLRGQPAFITRLFMGFWRPKITILGMDFAGLVETVGEGVTLFKPGDRVFGLSPNKYGAHAEYICLPERAAITTMPDGLRFAEAVTCEGAWYANTNLKAFGLAPGPDRDPECSILVYGASGAIGTAAVQLAKSYGARVTAVVDTQHVELARSLGADAVVDYTVADFTQTTEQFDCVFDAVGKTTFFHCHKLLKPAGLYAATDLGPWCQNLWLPLVSRLSRGRRVIFPMPTDSRAFVDFIKNKIEAGEFHIVIDRAYAFNQIVDAYRYVETAQKTGVVVINIHD